MIPIGNTPMVKLERMTEPGCAEIYVKYEGANPTGSMKDRMALAMIEGAERRGELKPGGTVVEYTGGSTGSSLAMVCAIKGYHARFVSSDAFSAEKHQTMRAFGAELELITGVGTGGSFSGNAEVLKQEIPGIRCIAIEPKNVCALSGGDISGKHWLEGIGSGFVPSI
jgi:cysteine synthase A